MEKYKRLESGKGRGCFKGCNRLTSEVVSLKELAIYPIVEGVPGSLIKEISLLNELEHPNIYRLIDVVNSGARITMVLVYERMDMSLDRFMLSYPKVMNIKRTIKELLRQILRAVSFYHSHNIVHGAIKPENIFVDPGTNHLKITDFIWPRSITNSDSEYPRENSSFNYMAPEILVEHKQFSSALDVWSVGCVFAEMVTRKPFFPANTEFHQLITIFSVMGTPSEETWPGINNLYRFLHVHVHSEPKDLRKLVPCLEPAGIDLLYKLLHMDPKGRITAKQALEHEYLQN